MAGFTEEKLLRLNLEIKVGGCQQKGWAKSFQRSGKCLGAQTAPGEQTGPFQPVFQVLSSLGISSFCPNFFSGLAESYLVPTGQVLTWACAKHQHFTGCF